MVFCDYSSQIKIPPGLIYELIACKHIEDGTPYNLDADLVSAEMINDGLEEGITKVAIYTLLNRLNPIRNVVKSKGQWSNNHEMWKIARYNFYLHMLVQTNETCKHKSVKNHLANFGSILPDWLDCEKLEKAGHCFSMKQVGWFDKVHVYCKVISSVGCIILTLIE